MDHKALYESACRLDRDELIGNLVTMERYKALYEESQKENEKLKEEIERRDQLEQDPTESEKQLLATQFNGFMGEMKELNKEIAQLKEENEKLKEANREARVCLLATDDADWVRFMGDAPNPITRLTEYKEENDKLKEEIEQTKGMDILVKSLMDEIERLKDTYLLCQYSVHDGVLGDGETPRIRYEGTNLEEAKKWELPIRVYWRMEDTEDAEYDDNDWDLMFCDPLPQKCPFCVDGGCGLRPDGVFCNDCSRTIKELKECEDY